jgi:N-acetylmuramoyl-L-alanine amidase
MPIHHIVLAGDSVLKLAHEHGLFADTIWHHPANAELRRRRPDMNVLEPGDAVIIPDKSTRYASVASGARHRFRRRGVPAKYRLQIVIHEQIHADEPYELIVDGVSREGRTDANGILDEYVSPSAQRGELIIGKDRLRVLIEFGHLEPASTVTGVQQRLRNLGYSVTDPDGEVGPTTAAALRAFQRAMDLDATGANDAATADKLDTVHASPGLLHEKPGAPGGA